MGRKRSNPNVWCICRLPQNGRFMIGCDGCDQWFHGSCVGINKKEADDLSEWLCPQCRMDQPQSKTNTHSVVIELKASIQDLHKEVSELRKETATKLEAMCLSVNQLKCVIEDKETTELRNKVADLQEDLKNSLADKAQLQSWKNNAQCSLERYTDSVSNLKKLCEDKDKSILELRNRISAYCKRAPKSHVTENTASSSQQDSPLPKNSKKWQSYPTSLQNILKQTQSGNFKKPTPPSNCKPKKHNRLSLSQKSSSTQNSAVSNADVDDDNFWFKSR